MIYTLTLNPALDKTCLVDCLSINEISRIQSSVVESGGKGFNVSRALTRAGIANQAFGFVGGNTGEMLLEGLIADELDVFPLKIAGETRVNQVFKDSNQQTIKVNAQGPRIHPDELQVLSNVVTEKTKPSDIWVLSGSLPQNIPPTIYADLIQQIHDARGFVFLDSSGVSFQMGLSTGPEWIKPNLQEAQFVFPNITRTVDILDAFHQMGVREMMLSLGANGLLYSATQYRYRVRVPVVNNDNVVGAGDATVAGFLYGYSHGYSPLERAKWAAAFGCASAYSDQNCFLNFKEVEDCYYQLKVEEFHA